MKTFYKTILLGAVFGLAHGCAKKRPVQKLYDLDSDRYPKTTLVDHVEWKAQATVVKTSSELGPAFVGTAGSFRLGHFEFTRDSLKFKSNYTVLKQSDDKLPEFINSWEIEHSDYRLAEVNGKVTNVEEEDDTKSWEEKAYFKVNWASNAINEFSYEPCWKEVGKEVVDGSQIFTPEHVTFVVEHTYELQYLGCAGFAEMSRRFNSENFTWTMQVRYSFAPHTDNVTYQPMQYKNEFDPDRKKYGYFEKVVDRFEPSSDTYEKSIFVTRFDPQKTHKIHFSPDFPEQYKWIFNSEKTIPSADGSGEQPIGVIPLTNKLFEKNGLPTRFEMVDDPDVLFGDVRKSFVYFGTSYSGSLLGWGPSYQHPLTGETLRSVSVVFPVGLEHLAKVYKDYVKNQANALENKDSSLYKNLEKTLSKHGIGGTPEEWVSTSENLKDPLVRQEFTRMITKNLFGNPSWSFAVGKPANSNANFLSLTDAFSDRNVGISGVDLGRQPGFNRPVARMMERVDPHHADQVNDILSEVYSNLETARNPRSFGYDHLSHQDTIFPLMETLSSIAPASIANKTPQQVVDSILYTTAIHEFGHNISLRHNFYGSVDSANFHSHLNGQPQRGRDGEELTVFDDRQNQIALTVRENTSSVMDYVPGTEESNAYMGWKPYDEAAIVFNYSDGALDLATHEYSPEGPKAREKAKSFLYCTDEHAAVHNPLCNRHDIGSTPSEIAWYKIQSYERAYKVKNFRYNRAYWDASTYPQRAAGSMLSNFDLLHLYRYVSRSWQYDIDPDLNLSALQRADIRKAIEDDSRRAASLLAAFYFSVVQQSSVDRDVTNVYDNFTGALQRVGILYDKLYSMVLLGDVFRWDVNFNDSAPEISFLEFIEEGSELGDVVRDVVRGTTIRNVELVQGFESLGRSLFLGTATSYANIDDRAKERMAIRCYTESGLKRAFDLDPQSWFPVLPNYYLNSPQTDEVARANAEEITSVALVTLWDGDLQFGQGLYPARDPYFRGKGEQVAVVVNINNRFYVASKEVNPYSFDFMKDYGTSDSGKRYILGVKSGYDWGRFNNEQDNCLAANDFDIVD